MLGVQIPPGPHLLKRHLLKQDMKIYVSHSKKYDFKNELYLPLRNSKLNKLHTIILPHEETSHTYNSKELFNNGCDLVIVEISYPSISIGIELGWANMKQIKIICIHKADIVPSSSINTICSTYIPYSNSAELIEKLINVFNL